MKKDHPKPILSEETRTSLIKYLNAVLSKHESDPVYVYQYLRKIAEKEYSNNIPVYVEIKLIWFKVHPSFKNFVSLINELGFSLSITDDMEDNEEDLVC